MGIETNPARDLQLIVPNLHRRYSGVTATNRMVALRLAQRFRAAWFGSDAPDGIARIGNLPDCLTRAGLVPTCPTASRECHQVIF